MFEIIISKKDGRKSKIVFAQEHFSSPKYIHCRNISLKRGKDHSQHPGLLFFYSICQKFCSWHNSLILFYLCSLKPAMNLIISALGFKHTVFFLFWATHWGTQQLFPGLSLERHIWMVWWNLNLLGRKLVSAGGGACWNMGQCLAIIMNISTISLLVPQVAGPPGKSPWATVLCFCRLLSHEKPVNIWKADIGRF